MEQKKKKIGKQIVPITPLRGLDVSHLLSGRY